MSRGSFTKKTALTALFSIICLISQSSFGLDVSGIVKDILDNPLSASIILHDPISGDTMYNTTSDAAGSYLFSDVVEGPYYICIETTGYPVQFISPYYPYNTYYPQYVTHLTSTEPSEINLTPVSLPQTNPPINILQVHLTDSAGDTITNSGTLSVALFRMNDKYRIYTYQRTSATILSISNSL